jgi:serine acetyltransferase
MFVETVTISSECPASKNRMCVWFYSRMYHVWTLDRSETVKLRREFKKYMILFTDENVDNTFSAHDAFLE